MLRIPVRRETSSKLFEMKRFFRGYKGIDYEHKTISTKKTERRSTPKYAQIRCDCIIFEVTMASTTMNNNNQGKRVSLNTNWLRATSLSTSYINNLKPIVSKWGNVNMSIISCIQHSQSIVVLVKNMVHHNASKHIEVWYHFVWNCITKGKLSLEKVSTAENIVDLMAESLSNDRFWSIKKQMGVKMILVGLIQAQNRQGNNFATTITKVIVYHPVVFVSCFPSYSYKFFCNYMPITRECGIQSSMNVFILTFYTI